MGGHRAELDQRILIDLDLLVPAALFSLTESVTFVRAERFAHQADEGRGEGFVKRIAAAALFVTEPYDLPRTTADRHHDLLVAVARNGGARLLVSSEPDLLRSFARGLTIATPEELLARLDRVGRLCPTTAQSALKVDGNWSKTDGFTIAIV